MNLPTTLATAETIHGWMTRRELEWLYATAGDLPPGGTWVELGVWKGRSLFTVAMGLPRDSRLVAVDHFAPITTTLPFVPTRSWVYDHFQVVLTAVKRLRSDLQIDVRHDDTAGSAAHFADGTVDVVFIDADHSGWGLARDVAAWLPKLKADGLLCGHDFSDGFPELQRIVNEMFPDRRIVSETSIWQVDRPKQNRPAAEHLVARA
jgi:hypothetical protein